MRRTYSWIELRNLKRRATRAVGDENPVAVLRHIGVLITAHGVAYVDDKSGRTVAAYVNLGETYARTVVYDFGVGRYTYESLGDFVERKELARPCRGGYRFA